MVRRLVQSRGYDIHKIREIHFDVLVAITARKIGAYLITRNAEDFTAIRNGMDFKLISWEQTLSSYYQTVTRSTLSLSAIFPIAG